jgi:hypothetical protein
VGDPNNGHEQAVGPQLAADIGVVPVAVGSQRRE